MAKFTNANFTETTITPSPANLFDFPGDEAGKASADGGGEKRKKRLLDNPPAASTREHVNSGKIYDWDDDDDENDKTTIKIEGKDSPRLSSSSASSSHKDGSGSTTSSLTSDKTICETKPPTFASYAFDNFASKSNNVTSGSDVTSPTTSEPPATKKR